MQIINKLKVQMGVPDELINIPYIQYKENSILIYNYLKLIDFDSEIIELDFFKIEGENLKIETLNKYCIKIKGRIFNIGIKNV